VEEERQDPAVPQGEQQRAAGRTGRREVLPVLHPEPPGRSEQADGARREGKGDRFEGMQLHCSNSTAISATLRRPGAPSRCRTGQSFALPAGGRVVEVEQGDGSARASAVAVAEQLGGDLAFRHEIHEAAHSPW
jgi:hypothetical protein